MSVTTLAIRIKEKFANMPNNITPTEKKNETRLFIFKYLKTMF